MAGVLEIERKLSNIRVAQIGVTQQSVCEKLFNGIAVN